MEFNIIIIGEANAGKTCLLKWFIANDYNLKNTPTTLGVDLLTKKIELEGKKVLLKIWDTAGCEKFQDTMAISYFR